MPTLRKGSWTVDYIDEGVGPTVVLVHGSASNNRQWQTLVSTFKARRRVLAPNLFGYGTTSPWHGSSLQKVSDQAALIGAILEHVEGEIDFVGHSFGALVALEVAATLGDKVRRLLLFEPNPFALLNRPGYLDQYAEVQRLYEQVKTDGLRGDWLAVAERFINYFAGEGSWNAMPVERRSALAASLRPNLDEWDAVMDPDLQLANWKTVTASTLLVWARDTRSSLRAVVEVLLTAYPYWERLEIQRGGHTAPVTHSRVFNVLVERFLLDY